MFHVALVFTMFPSDHRLEVTGFKTPPSEQGFPLSARLIGLFVTDHLLHVFLSVRIKHMGEGSKSNAFNW